MTDQPGTAVEQAAAAVPADVPAEWAALMRLAARIAPTSFVPKPMRGNPGEVLAAMMYGAELGLAPIAALRSIHVIDGQPTASVQLMRSLILREGHMLQWREVTAERVVVYGRRRDTGADALVTWTLDDARRAKLTGKGNWSQWPRQMLAARATSELARLLFADLLQGLAYTPDEINPARPFDAIDIAYDPAPTVDEDTEPDPHDDRAVDPEGVTAGEAQLDLGADEDAAWIEQARGTDP